MFPLGMALLPGEILPLQIFEPRYRTMLVDCLARPEPAFGVVLIERGHELGGGDERHMIATDAHIVEHRVRDDGRAVLRCVGAERLRVVEWLPDDPYPVATVQPFPDGAVATADTPALEARYAAVAEDIRNLFELVRSAGQAQATFDDTVYGDIDRSYAWAGQLPLGQADRYALLAAESPVERIGVLAEAVESVTAAIQFQLMD
ncbi:LON peptidase substrate-binding domain-containing protein [Williamsia sp. CHRR-6]|uniref:LON peptidase substrate-binding domain-containing protein n=1 Tax=Williamsia sp. CHRR-6 TaxID=2835871 RepID=UPI001BD9559E|nr:LON peptidase substrate-binding domain-containing protein [Williamsia sp. CHRR-6]MBT0566112.1 LON peptidase substrate-binding domain-containing protein [Williamsia sp. CHRR-6]